MIFAENGKFFKANRINHDIRPHRIDYSTDMDLFGFLERYTYEYNITFDDICDIFSFEEIDDINTKQEIQMAFNNYLEIYKKKEILEHEKHLEKYKQEIDSLNTIKEKLTKDVDELKEKINQAKKILD